ncbi:unnamed protein product, partial [Ectocarpus sp. 8 AP-2014]
TVDVHHHVVVVAGGLPLRDLHRLPPGGGGLSALPPSAGPLLPERDRHHLFHLREDRVRGLPQLGVERLLGEGAPGGARDEGRHRGPPRGGVPLGDLDAVLQDGRLVVDTVADGVHLDALHVAQEQKVP